MKIVTISKIGYNAPSGANWAYGIWKMDLIDTEQPYQASHTLKETFGGDYRLREKYRELTGNELMETKGVYTSTGTQKITGVSGLLDIESVEVINIIKKFLNIQ